MRRDAYMARISKDHRPSARFFEEEISYGIAKSSRSYLRVYALAFKCDGRQKLTYLHCKRVVHLLLLVVDYKADGIDHRLTGKLT